MNPARPQLTSSGSNLVQSASHSVSRAMKKLVTKNHHIRSNVTFCETYTSIFSSHADNMSKKHWGLYQESHRWETTESIRRHYQ